MIVAENKQPQFGNPARDQQLEHAIQFLDQKLAQLDAANAE